MLSKAFVRKTEGEIATLCNKSLKLKQQALEFERLASALLDKAESLKSLLKESEQ